MLKENKQLLVLTHLSQLIVLITGFGSLLLPLVIWLTQKDKVYELDQHGKQILNFQISLLIYTVICVPLILLFGLGLLGFILLAVGAIILPILNAIKVSNNQDTSYPFSFDIIK
ncbi:DUF4870 domain-containing protein [Aurantibacter sp.]|uniref:DUF4870 domain-containing protein n=1 Tax=Aurantibacter sp. TaxID=2807103 RepID=UPI0035C7A6B9